MPLSDEEARLLHQLEQSLAAEDPSFASTLRGSARMVQGRRLTTLSIVGFLAGLGVLFTGVVMANTWVGVLGFVLMLLAAYAFVAAGRRGLGVVAAGGDRLTGKGPKRSGSIIERLDERWQRRQRDNGF